MAKPQTEEKKLTALSVEELKPSPDGPRVIRDTDTKGLRLVIYPTGKRSFVMFYRTPQGTLRKYTLGQFPALSLADARKKVSDTKNLLENAKTDPKLAASPEADPASTKRETRQAIRAPVPEDALYPAVVRRYFADYIMGRATKSQKKPKQITIVEAARLLGLKGYPGPWVDIKGGLASKWKDKRFDAITKADVKHYLDDLLHNGSPNRKNGIDKASGSPVTANRTYAALKALFGWAKREDIITKPATDIVAWSKAIEEERKRFLSEEEIKVFWQATGEMEYPSGPMLRLLLLTGQRAREVGEMKRGEVDLTKRLWTIPGELTGRTKNREEHVLPLTDAVLEILNSLPKFGDNAPYLFSHNAGVSPVTDYFKMKERCLGRMEKLLERRYDPDGKWPDRPWVIHDLRHTFSTLNNERDPAAEGVIEAVLNHVKSGMKGKYNHAKYLMAKYNLLDAWGREVARIVEGRKTEAGTVLPFMRA